MSKVFLIIGKSFSGKDTLLNNIIKDKEFCTNNKLNKTIRYTTRPIRPGEIDGVDYHFINDIEYEEKYKYNPNVVISSFDSIYGNVHYITDLEKLHKDKNYIGTGDIDLINGYKNILDDDLCVILLLPPDWVLFERFCTRDDSVKSLDEKYKEIHRRYRDELVTFGRLNLELANISCIISVAKDPDMDDIKKYMKNFINGDSNSVILNPNNNYVFDNHYEYPDFYSFSSTYSSVFKDEIILHNRGIVIHHNDESYEVNI